jgi:hypothetical protein
MKIKNLKLEQGETKWYRSQDESILCVAWRTKKQKKTCVVVSTNAVVGNVDVVSRHKKQITKPAVLHAYNMSMNECDRVDQSVSYYGNYDRKTVKWWKRIFYWLLEICQANAYILHSLTRNEDKKT